MYKTILVPVDLARPEKGKPMIEIARRIGGKDARIVLVNVVEDVPTYVVAELEQLGGYLEGGYMKNAREKADEELTAIAKAAGIKPDYEVRSGKVPHAILDVAEKQEADLIIIGSHKPALQDYLLSSTASRVVRHATCSVLVMR